MNDKRQQLLDTALCLFYSKGVQAVGINEILKTSGIAKKTLYHHFPAKDDLVLAALSARDDTFCYWFEGLIKDAASDEELVDRMFSGLSQWFCNDVAELQDFRGCFFINTSAEYSDSEGKIPLFCKAHKENVRGIIGRYLKRQDEDLLDCLCMLKEGAIVLAYVSQDSLAAERAMKTAKQFLALTSQVAAR